MMPVLEGLSSRLTEWSEEIMYQLLEKVTVLSRVRIRVTLRDGQEIEQAVNQPKDGWSYDLCNQAIRMGILNGSNRNTFRSRQN